MRLEGNFSRAYLAILIVWGTLLPAFFFSAWGGFSSSSLKSEIVIYESIWYESATGTALFCAAALPLIFGFVCLASGLLAGMVYAGKTRASRKAKEILFWSFLLSLVLGFLQLYNYGHLLRRILQ